MCQLNGAKNGNKINGGIHNGDGIVHMTKGQGSTVVSVGNCFISLIVYL